MRNFFRKLKQGFMPILVILAALIFAIFGCAGQGSSIKLTRVDKIPSRQYEQVTVIEIPTEQARGKDKYYALVFGGKVKLTGNDSKNMGSGTPEQYKIDMPGMIFYEIKDSNGNTSYTASTPGISVNAWQGEDIVTVTIDTPGDD